MSNIAKLKKKAAELENRKQYDKALELYEQVLNSARAGDEDRDVALYNRVGDLHYRIGNSEQAIGYYEQAADYYAEGGFFNNAIALCNKILRYSPGRTIIYYKLGIISAKKGFNSDAKQNFLEYADRMQRMGKMDEAFRALKEFADLCPGQDDVRLMLAEQLARADRKTEALEQLELLHETLEAEGRTGEATATLERMKSLDPAFKPRRSTTPRARKKEGLVFLDLDFDSPPAAGEKPVAAQSAEPSARSAATPKPAEPEASSAPLGLELTSLSDESVSADNRSTTDSPIARADAEEPQPSAANELKFISAAEDTLLPVPDIAPIELAPLVESATDKSTADEPDVRGAEAQPRADDATSNAPLEVPSYPHMHDPLAGLDVLPPVEPDIDGNGNLGFSDHVDDDGFIDLGEWLESTRTPASTRMVAHDEEPENEEQKDFAEMLDKFKAGISRNVDEEDFESHYDLGIAFREMGLLDEAIGSFQKAARGPQQLVRASEAIGECFMEKGDAAVTMTVLERVAKEPGMTDSRLVGVLYLMGRAAESLGRPADASSYFQRVLAVQIGFRDAAHRLASLAQASR